MAYHCTDTRLGVPMSIAYGAATDFPSGFIEPQIGTIVPAYDPFYGYGEFVWAYGVASLAAGEVVSINPLTGAATRTVAATRGAIIGVSMVANTSTTTASWYQITGAALAKVAAAFASGNPVYSTATPGTVDDAVVAGSGITSAVSISAIGYSPGTKVASVTNGSNIITVSSLDGLVAGMTVTGTGVSGTITSIGFGGVFPPVASPMAQTIQLSAAATVTGNPTITFTATGSALIGINRAGMSGLG